MTSGLINPPTGLSLRPPDGRKLYIPPLLVAGLAVVSAAAAGRYIGEGRTSVGVAIVVAAAFVPLVFLDIALAVAAFGGLVFIVHLSVLSVAPTAIEILIALAWLGAGGARRGRLPVLQEHEPLILAMLALASWLLLSTAWSPSPGRSATSAAYIWVAVLTFIVVATSLTSARDVRVVAVAFVIGAVVSVTLGLLGIGNANDPTNAGRLVGGGGDPNAQAAGFLAAMFLAAALATVLPRRVRTVTYVALVLTVIGFFGAESRGGLLALGVAAISAVVLLPGYRRQLLVMYTIGAIGLAGWVSVQPNALKRITDFSGGGSGRADLWTVAMRIFDGHPIVGSGLDSFQTLEPHYALQPGPLSQVHIVSEAPEIVHNTYLQLMTETGVIGLALFALVAALALRAAWLAARRFDAIGERGFANLARAALIGEIGMLAALFFLSDADDPRLWLLFALGPVLSTLAKSQTRARASQPSTRGAVVTRATTLSGRGPRAPGVRPLPRSGAPTRPQA